jgi:hypothetical protein
MPAVYEYVEDNEVFHASRIKADTVLERTDTVLERNIAPLLQRRFGRPSNKPEVHYASFSYQAKSLDRPRRLVANVEWRARDCSREPASS